MAESKTVKVEYIELRLSPKEAQWLRAYLQNAIGSETSAEEHLRAGIFNALPSQYPR